MKIKRQDTSIPCLLYTSEQLMGQIASAKIPLSRMISPQLYWVMSDSELTLDINNPEEPKILWCRPDRKKQHKTSKWAVKCQDFDCC